MKSKKLIDLLKEGVSTTKYGCPPVKREKKQNFSPATTKYGCPPIRKKGPEQGLG